MRDEIRFKGINAELNGYDSDDGACAAMSGLWVEGQRLQSVRLPETQFTLGDGLELIGVHETSAFRHLIFRAHYQGGWLICWADDDVTGEVTVETLSWHSVFISPSSEIKQMVCIGNTIMLLAADGIKYLLWRTDETRTAGTVCGHLGAYTYLGDHLPELPIRFGLAGHVVKYPDTLDDAHTDFTTDQDGGIAEDKRLEYTNHIKGIMNRLIAEKGTNAGKFIFPFLVRYAYRLYDGSLVMHSAPVLMTPSTNMAPLLLRRFTIYDGDGVSLVAAAIACGLRYQALESREILSPWKDIVQSVDIFVTPPIYTYDQGGDNLTSLAGSQSNTEPYMWTGRMDRGLIDTTFETRYYFKTITDSKTIFDWKPEWIYWVRPPMKDEEKIAEEVRTAGDFYLLKSIKIEDLATDAMTEIEVPDGYLQSLLQRERMEDDYGSHDKLLADVGYVYNNRVNLSGLRKERYGGHQLRSALQYSEQAGQHNVTAENYWRLSDQNGVMTVTSGLESYNSSVLAGGYLFYPSTDCTKAIVNYGGQYKELAMRPHAMLNGSVWFEGFNSVMPMESVTAPTVTGNNVEDISDKIYTSGINNPFAFPLSGINTVPGGGKVIGMASATKALSQGQFGQFPLYAFTTTGVWALEVNGQTAGYSARQPIGRDVCLSAESVTQTDDAVLFVSDRGVMVVTSSKITCLSDKVRDALIPVEGSPDGTKLGMRDYMRGCRMVYDYACQRLIVYHPDYDYALVYGIESGEWGGGVLGVTGHVAAWPSPYVVSGREVRALDGSKAAGAVAGWLETGPLKLQAGADVLKTVRSVIVRGEFRGGNVHASLEGSRDLYRWAPIWSSATHRVRGYSGTPWKYFRLRLWTLIEEDESLSGLSVDYVAKYLGKMR